MKKCLLILLCFSATVVKAQLAYDFNSKIVTYDQSVFGTGTVIRNNTDLQVIVKNVNRFLYDVTITVNNQDFFGSAPTAATSPIVQLVALGGSASSKSFLEDQKSLLLDENSDAYKKLTDEQKSQMKAEFVQAEEILKDNFRAFQDYIAVFKKRDEIFAIAQVNEQTLQNQGWFNVSGKFENQTAADYAAAMALYKQLAPVVQVLKSEAAYINPVYKPKVDIVTAQFDNNAYQTALDAFKTGQQNVKADCFTYQLDQPFNVNGDEADVAIAITPKATAKNLMAETKTYKIPVYGGWKITFSSGLFMSKLVNPHYTLKDTYKTRIPDNTKIQYDTTAYRSIIADKNDSWAMGVSALMHFGYRWSKYDEIALHLGIGTAFQSDFKPQYFYGLSYIRGYKRRIGFNVGFAMSQVTELSNSADLTRRYDPAFTTIPTTTKFLFNQFQCSITYSIFDSNKTATAATGK